MHADISIPLSDIFTNLTFVEPPEVYASIVTPAPGAFGILTTDSLQPFVRNVGYIMTGLFERVFTSVSKKFITQR